MNNALDDSLLRQSGPRNLALYLRRILTEQPDDKISAHLFAAVQREALPPTVLSIWLGISRSPASLLYALKQEFSVLVRSVAINRFLKLLGGKDWMETWNGVGGTPGLLSLLSQFSVSEVKMLLKRIPRCLKGPHLEDKRARITELLQGLLPFVYQNAPFKSSDGRPLVEIYSSLIPACSSQFVDELLRDGTSPLLRSRRYQAATNSRLLREQYELLARHCLDIIFESGQSSVDLKSYLCPLLQSAPPIPSPEPGYSESMLFSLTILRKLAARQDIKVKGHTILKDLIEPLLRRARAKHLDWTQIGEMMDLSITYLTSHPDEANHLSFRRGSFIYFSILFWALSSAQRPQFEARLVSILRMIPNHKNRSMEEYELAVSWIRLPLRYRLLRIFFLHMGTKTANVELKEGLTLLSAEKWPCSLFLDIERGSAVALLKRLCAINVDDTFLKRCVGNTILSLPPSKALPHAHSSILLGLLEQDESGALERGASAVDNQKNQAVKSREQTDRAFYTKAALFSAIASGSLGLYNDTLIWARRFVRDPLTAMNIFAKSVTNTEEGICLLSGIPRNFERSQKLKPSDIRMKVLDANRVILVIFETTCLALKEPSFHQPHWIGPLQLLGDVIKKRLDLSGALQRSLQLSDDEIYEILWSNTLDLALQIERLSLEPGYEDLSIRDPVGLLQLNYFAVSLKGKLPSSFRFIDNLAKERDSLWREFRPSLSPAAAALPLPLPRGLPIQCLAPNIDIAIESASGLTPFIFSRAEAVVFPEPQDALRPVPEDKETMSAVGPFVDSFSLALQIYVLQGSTPDVRHERTMHAWAYAIERLSKGRMTQDEAHRTWKAHFRRALPTFEMPGPDPEQGMEYPLFPFDCSIDNVMEWNPADAFNPPPAIKPRPLQPPTLLDCSINMPSSRTYLQGEFIEPHPQTEGFEPYGFDVWSIKRMSRKQVSIPAVREGLVFSALLFLESCSANAGSILLLPFPSKSDIRYPYLWLDFDFMVRQSVGCVEAAGLLKELLATVPPTLLLRLADAALNALLKSESSGSQIVRTEQLAYALLSLLTESDQPSLATELILKTIIELPESSSWHRQLLSRRILKRLSASKAEILVKSFARAIQAKMKEQADALTQSVERADSGSSTTPKPYIKITTVKYLAQLLNDQDFVPEKFAINILSRLLQASTHLDVRAAIVGSMLGMLGRCEFGSSKPLGEQIIVALEYIIPIAGDMDERRQLREEDWVEAERTGKLPEFYDQGNNAVDLCIPPILGAIIYAASLSLYLDVEWQRLIARRILLPILERSIATNTRWLQLFAAKHGLELHSLDLPLLPVKPKVLKQMLDFNGNNPPASLMYLYHRFILANISPPVEVALLNEKLQSPAFRNLPETKHWLSLYGHGPSIYCYDGFKIPRMLRYKFYSSPTSDITPAQVQDYVFEQAKLLILCSELATFKKFMRDFEPNSWGKDTDPVEWLGDAKRVVESIITFIDSMRTPAWQREPQRQPAVLPESLKYKLWLLPYPTLDAGDEKFGIFADGLRRFLKGIIRGSRPYHEELPEVHTAALRVLPCYRAQVACQLGGLKKGMELIDFLCVEIAQALFKAAGPPQDSAVAGMSRKLLRSWRESEFETVRRRGMTLLDGNVFINKNWGEMLLGE